jgi:hypothetical protein
MTEKIQLQVYEHGISSVELVYTRRVASTGLNRSFVSASRITRSHISSAGTMVEVTKSGIAYETIESVPPRSTMWLEKPL